jgi:hypothetical protein
MSCPGAAVCAPLRKASVSVAQAGKSPRQQGILNRGSHCSPRTASVTIPWRSRKGGRLG